MGLNSTNKFMGGGKTPRHSGVAGNELRKRRLFVSPLPYLPILLENIPVSSMFKTTGKCGGFHACDKLTDTFTNR